MSGRALVTRVVGDVRRLGLEQLCSTSSTSRPSSSTWCTPCEVSGRGVDDGASPTRVADDLRTAGLLEHLGDHDVGPALRGAHDELVGHLCAAGEDLDAWMLRSAARTRARSRPGSRAGRRGSCVRARAWCHGESRCFPIGVTVFPGATSRGVDFTTDASADTLRPKWRSTSHLRGSLTAGYEPVHCIRATNRRRRVSPLRREYARWRPFRTGATFCFGRGPPHDPRRIHHHRAARQRPNPSARSTPRRSWR